MQLSDTRTIAAPPPAVWQALLDPAVLKDCIPGCESMTGTPDTGFEAVVVQKVGPVKARFTGLVQLLDRDDGHSLRIQGEGKGGAAGFAKGGAQVTLDPVPEGTRLTYTAEANVGGKLAQLGSRIIDGFARKMADDFFARFQARVEGPPPDTAAASDTDTDTATAADADPAVAAGADGEDTKKKGWLRRIIG